LPVAFAILCSPWVVWLQEETNLCCFLIGLELAVVASLPFPFYCNQALCLFARRGKWASKDKAPELYDGIPRFWWLCLILGIVSVVTLVAVTLTRLDAYASYAKQILQWAQTVPLER